MSLAENFTLPAKCEHRICPVKRKWAKTKPIYVNPQSSCFASGNPYTSRKREQTVHSRRFSLFLLVE